MEFPKHPEELGRRERTRIERVRSVVHYLTAHVTAEPFPAMSDHFYDEEPAPELGIKTELNRWHYIADL